MINTPRPSSSTPQNELNIGSGFNLLVGGGYKLIISPLISGLAFSNTARPSQGQTWDTWTTPWGSETRTWLELSQLISNESRPITSISNTPRP